MAPSLKLVSERHVAQTHTLTAKATQAIWGLWAALAPEQWWDDTTTWAIAAQSANLASSALQTARRQARSYAVRALMAAGAPAKTLPPVEELYPRSDTLDVDTYWRPAMVYRWKTSQGQRDTAADRAHARLEALIRDDISTAQRRVETDTYRMTDEVIGWRRIIHPELSMGGTCGLCVAAANNIYSVQTLMPIHDRCNCLPAAVTAASDPGLTLNAEDLEALYARAGSTDADDLSTLRFDGNPEKESSEKEPATETGSAGGGNGNGGSSTNKGGDGGDEPPEAPNNQFDAEGEHPLGPEWTQRQKALNISTGGDWLEIGDIEGLEHYQSLEPNIPLSKKIKWIPTDKIGRKPTDDFGWLANGGIHIEMKRVRNAKYSAIHNAINSNVKDRNQKHPGLTSVKNNFMVSIGNHALTDQLRWQLEKYNERNPTNPIKRLWILWRNNLEEIVLK